MRRKRCLRKAPLANTHSHKYRLFTLVKFKIKTDKIQNGGYALSEYLICHIYTYSKSEAEYFEYKKIAFKKVDKS